MASSSIQDLLAISEQAKRLGKKYTDTVTEQVTRCTHDHGLLLAIAERLDHVLVEIPSQIQLAEAITSRITGTYTTFAEYAQQSVAEQSDATQALDAIFNELRNTVIDERCGSDLAGETLFDFVDNDAVQKVEAQLKSHCQEMFNLDMERNTIVTSVSQLHTEEKQAAYGVLEQSDPDKLQALRRRILDLTPSVKAVQGDRDRMLEMMAEVDTLHATLQSAAEQGKQAGDDEARDANKATERIESLQELYGTATTRTEELTNLVSEYRALYTAAVAAHNATLSFCQHAAGAVAKLTTIHTTAAQLYTDAQDLCDELRNLTEWYLLFRSAYLELPGEVTRRQQDAIRRYDIANYYQRELKNQFDAEWQKRSQFFEYRARYLPPVFIAGAGLTELPVGYEIFPQYYATPGADHGEQGSANVPHPTTAVESPGGQVMTSETAHGIAGQQSALTQQPSDSTGGVSSGEGNDGREKPVVTEPVEVVSASAILAAPS